MEKLARIAYEDIEFTSAEIVRRQAAISENSLAYLQDWRSGAVDPKLEPYQEPAFEALLRFTHENGQAILTDEDVRHIQSGYLDEPTSFGKTAIIARFLEAVKIGTLPTPDSRVPIRALIGTLSQYAVKQTASLRDMSRGLKKFLPNANITANFADHPDLSGDACLITYRALLLLARANKLNNLPFDIGIGDEAHNLLGRETSKIWRAFAVGRRTVGLTATPEYGPHKKLDMLFDERIHSSDLRSLIVAGELSGVQVLGFGTGARIESGTGRDDFSEVSLEPLLRNTRRNQAICNITTALVAEGRQVIVNALPGEGLFHAQLIAGALHSREYIDASGVKRKLRAAAIGTHISSKQCDKILEAFREGDYDVIVQIDKINQSFDGPNVGAIVNAAPTLSQVRSTQRVGRVMRPNEEWPIKIIVEFIDDVEGPRMQHTAWHVLGETEMKQGVVVASKELLDELDAQAKSQKQPAKNQESKQSESKKRRICVPSVEDFDELLQAMHQDYAVRLVDSLLLAANKGYGPPPKGWRELRRVVESKFSDRSLGLDGIRGLLERKGDDFCQLSRSSRGPAYFISPEAEHFLDGYEFPEAAPNDAWKTEREIAREHNLTRDVVRRCSKDLETRDFLIPQINRVHAHFGPEQIATIAQRAKQLKEQEAMAKTLIAATALASEPGVNWDRASIHYFLVSHYGVEGMLLKSGPGPDGRYYTVDEADLVRRHRKHSFQVTQAELKKRQIVDLEAESGHTRDEIMIAASELRLTEHVKDGRYKDRKGAYHYTELAAAPVADKILNHLQNPPLAQSKPSPPSRMASSRSAINKESPLPAPVDDTKEGNDELQDVSVGLRSLDAPCQPSIIPLLIRYAKLDPNSFERRRDRYLADENAILDLADHIQTYPIATYEMETPKSIAERLNVELEYVLLVASRAVANIGKEAGLYRGREDEEGNAGMLEIYYSHRLSSAIIRYVAAQKQRMIKKQPRR